MQVHYDEGVANRIGPEPCVFGREAEGEASAGGRIGQPLSHEIINRDADAVVTAEGETEVRVNASACPVLRVADPGMYVNSSAGNRETSALAAREVSGPHREGDEPKPMMHGAEESDSAIVAVKRANEAGRPGEEFVEPRAEAEENAEQEGTPRTPSRQGASHGLDRVRQAARAASPSTIQGGSRMP